MSLRDRFNTANTKNSKMIEFEEKLNTPQYYSSDEEAQNTVSLGVVDTLLEDDDINAIFVNGPRNIFIERKTKLHRSTVAYRDEIQLQNIIKKRSKSEEVFVKFNHKQGINVTATLPPLTKTSTMHIKCYKDKFATFEHLEENQSISKEISIFFQTLLKSRKNIIITGDKKSLKTTFLSALAKKMPTNNRYALIDFSKEIETDKSNFTDFDLSNLENEKEKETIIKSVFSSCPDGVFLNDFEFDVDCVTKNILNGYKGVVLNITASSKEESIEKISIEFLKILPHLTLKEARELVYQNFDFVVYVENKEEKKVSSVSEILFDNNICQINDIFLLNDSMLHYSTGYAPDMFLEDDIDTINLNIFNSDYKHTYTISPFKDLQKKGLNPDVLKKFRKDLSSNSFEKFSKQQIEKNEAKTKIELCMDEQEKNLQNLANETNSEEITKNVEAVYNDEFMKKAQEKFDEIRKNLKTDES